jgi:hypothetical protein
MQLRAANAWRRLSRPEANPCATSRQRGAACACSIWAMCNAVSKTRNECQLLTFQPCSVSDPIRALLRLSSGSAGRGPWPKYRSALATSNLAMCRRTGSLPHQCQILISPMMRPSRVTSMPPVTSALSSALSSGSTRIPGMASSEPRAVTRCVRVQPRMATGSSSVSSIVRQRTDTPSTATGKTPNAKRLAAVQRAIRSERLTNPMAMTTLARRPLFPVGDAAGCTALGHAGRPPRAAHSCAHQRNTIFPKLSFFSMR